MSKKATSKRASKYGPTWTANRDSIWVTADWKEIAVKDMKTSHIRNSLARIKEHAGWRDEFTEVFEMELKMRTSPLGKALE